MNKLFIKLLVFLKIKHMKTLQDVLVEVQAVIAQAQTVAVDVQALIDAQPAPTPVTDEVVEVDLKKQSGATVVIPVPQG